MGLRVGAFEGFGKLCLDVKGFYSAQRVSDGNGYPFCLGWEKLGNKKIIVDSAVPALDKARERTRPKKYLNIKLLAQIFLITG